MGRPQALPRRPHHPHPLSPASRDLADHAGLQEHPGSTGKPSVPFVCVHDAGRSQMAAACLHHLSGGRIEVRSAGSAPEDAVDPAAEEAMAEEGIDMSARPPRILTDEAVQDADVVVTMGCGDACPFYPGKGYEDRRPEDPAGMGVVAVRPIRDDIKTRVQALIAELLTATTT